ncbi:MAG: hypothetical protein MRERV_2c031 [Mycoplasmataceae bacterium RV_VA103A]|nr:MAG: hypothetical protein MRERV_2c031 [Mycoplasmataceae bacterium RV_VA103A]
MVNAQQWLEENYPDKEECIDDMYVNQQLEGVLDCGEYKNLWKIFVLSSVDSSKFEIKGGSWYEGRKRETKITPCILAQEYINQAYPTQKEREEIKELKIYGEGLEGELDLSDFKNLEELDCSDNCLTNLNLNNCLKLNEINCQYNQLTTLNLSNLVELKRLECYNNYLTQIPNIPNPEKITDLRINNNNINPSNLTIFSQFRNLKWLEIGNEDKNKINQGIYNHFSGSLEPLKDSKKLLFLNIKNTDINSGWEYLPDSLWYFYYKTDLRPNCKLALATTELEKEIWADIHKDFAPRWKKDWLKVGFSKEQTKKIFTELNKDTELVRSQYDAKFINWFLNFKKLDLEWAKENEEEFADLRDKYEHFKTCKECKNPNTSRDWCQSCNAKHFQQEFNNWTSGNSKIDAFIQQCQLEATSPWNLLEWIPYEKFSNIEHIAQGGFGKVEKAEWEEGSIEKWNNEKGEWEKRGDYDSYDYNTKKYKFKDYKTVALKTLSNSQNLNQNFLQELTLYKMFRSSVSNMAPCYGISQDKEGNYIMVMEFMKEGNLREYLKKNHKELEFCDVGEYGYIKTNKLLFLKQISQGLKDIHRKNLVHRDFHSGNIIVDDYNCRITDLGLSKPVDEAKTDHNIYGLMPYVAPEVLQGQLYTPKADIYSLGMIMYEIITGIPPYAEQAHDTDLALQICQGIRSQFPPQVKYPQLLIDLITKCWDNEPNNRPTAREVSNIMGEWFNEYSSLKIDTQLYHQLEEAEKHNQTLPYEVKFPTYQSQETWHSKKIDTKEITRQLQSLRIGSKQIDFDIPEEEEQQETSPQAQIQQPPK